MTRQSQWSRRDFLGAATLFAAVVGVPASVAALSRLDDADLPTDRQRRMMREVAQLVIPRTKTAGAGDVGVGDFVILALAHGLEGTRKPPAPPKPGETPPPLTGFERPDGTLRYVAWLEAALDRAANGDWIGKPAAKKGELLAALDAQAFEKGPVESPWRKIKGLILTGYYTSEEGGSRELNFELVPGRYDPNVVVTPATHSYSSDWTAVDFG